MFHMRERRNVTYFWSDKLTKPDESVVKFNKFKVHFTFDSFCPEKTTFLQMS